MRAGSRRGGVPPPAREITVAFAGDRQALAVRTVRRIVNYVLERERVAGADITVTFLSSTRMRTLNRRTFGRDRSTDVIAFPLPHPNCLVGDVYICPATARRSARLHRVPVREEMVRLVVHGLLHVTGHDHPDTSERESSAMWRTQEEYVREFLGRKR